MRSKIKILSIEEGSTKEEHLERDYWSLQVSFQLLLKDNKTMAMKFLDWAVTECENEVLDLPKQ